MTTHPSVTIIVPCLNEEKTIVPLLEAIEAQTYSREKLEVIIADGMSSDRTRDRIENFKKKVSAISISVLDNPARRIPVGLNLAIKCATGEIISRMDAHAKPAPDYVQKCVDLLEAGLGTNVGGVIDIVPGKDDWIGRSIAIATAHPLGVGDALYRHAQKPTRADTVAFGTFYRKLIEEIGPFDETLRINEDYEFNTRVRKNGGTIWIDPKIRIEYHSRPDLCSLAKQYFNYGFWKLRMLRRYPETIRWRQALPPVFVFGLLMLLLLSTFWLFARVALAALLGSYFLILIIGSVKPANIRKDIAHIIGVPLAITVMHISWGAGFWWSMLRLFLQGKENGN